MKKIAIPSSNGRVNDHFGQSEAFTIITLDAENNVTDEEIMTAGKGCGCKSNLSNELADKGVSILLAGNMGQGAINKLEAAGIKAYRGFSGEVKEVVTRYLNGERGVSIVCDHHDHHEH